MSMQTYEQTEAFPRTALDVLNELAGIQQAEYEKAIKALDALGDDEKIARAYEKAEERVAKARRLVASINELVQALSEAERREAGQVLHLLHDMKRTAEQAGSGLSISINDSDPVVIAEAPKVELETGEVMSPGEAISQTPHVLVYWPDGQAAHRTDVGEHTTYGELVADYLAAIGADEDVHDYRLSGHSDWCPRDLDAMIVPSDYGITLELKSVKVPSPEPVS